MIQKRSNNKKGHITVDVASIKHLKNMIPTFFQIIEIEEMLLCSQYETRKFLDQNQTRAEKRKFQASSHSWTKLENSFEKYWSIADNIPLPFGLISGI